MYIQGNWKCIPTQNPVHECIEALFIIARKWKQPKGPSSDEWNKQMYNHIMEYYSVIEKNEVLIIGYNMDEPWNILRNEKPKGHILFDSIYTECPE